MTPEQMHPAAHPTAGRRRRQALPALIATLGVGVGLVFGVLWGLGAQQLGDSRSQVVDLTGQLEDLESRATAAEEERDQLQQQLSAAAERAESGLDDLDDERADLADREQALAKRAQALHVREQELDTREADLESQEAAADDEPDDSLISEDPTASAGTEFDQAWLLSKSKDAVGDIRSIDRSLQDGIGVATALSMLSDSFGRMAEAGAPPGVNASTYLARLDTLQTFATDAARLYDQDPVQAAAKYEVLREQAGRLLEQINGVLGTDLRLPS